jgi:hypothetical protein
MNGPIEPSADLRALAQGLRQMYLALVEEGFTQTEALVVIGQIIAANTQSNP